jgi:signal transduction histidine kinase
MLTLTAALLALLPLLAALQYRWLGQVSASERERMQMNLRTAAMRFSHDFDRELTRAYRLFQMDASAWREQSWEELAQCYDRWMTTAPYPRLVSDVFIVVQEEGGRSRLLRFNPTARRIEPVEWPAELTGLRERLERQAERVISLRNVLGEQLSRMRLPSEGSSRQTADPASPPHNFTKAVVRIALGQIAEEIPALVIPAIHTPLEQEQLLHLPANCLVVRLDAAYLKQEFLPALAKRHFYDGETLNYNLAITSRSDPQQVYYQLGQPLPATAFSASDATANLGGLRFDDPDILFFDSKLRPNNPAAIGSGRSNHVAVYSFRSTTAEAPPGLAALADDVKRWQLVIKHRAGSLEAAVTSTRRRNLAISFGILLLLAVSIGLILVSTRRAQRLAQQQMEFVSAVSHELRTPLAVIRSAGENLADGVIDDREQVRRYGELIRGEGRRLTEMVEQVLEFAGAESGRKNYELRPVEVTGLIESTLAAYQQQIIEGGFHPETAVPAGLPPIKGDLAALRHALQNLLSNAMKYGGEDRWIGLNAQIVAGEGGAEVRITVTDHGRGIAAEDLPHIFEPFYRGREAVAAQIHGDGLGLSLVKRILEAHGGRVSVESKISQGAAFTLHIPVASQTGLSLWELSATVGNQAKANG